MSVTINGKEQVERVGSRRQVWNKTAYQTAGGLTRADLKLNKWGRIVSREASAAAKKLDNLGDKRAPAFGSPRKSLRKRRGASGRKTQRR